jgi:hypothetical protein
MQWAVERLATPLARPRIAELSAVTGRPRVLPALRSQRSWSARQRSRSPRANLRCGAAAPAGRGDRGDEHLELTVGRLELGGPLADPLLELGVRSAQLVLGAALLADGICGPTTKLAAAQIASRTVTNCIYNVVEKYRRFLIYERSS